MWRSSVSGHDSRVIDIPHLHSTLTALSWMYTMPDEIDLNCWVFGDKPPRKRIFPLRVSRSQTVHYLRKAVKDEKKPALDHIATNSLDLWKVSMPIDKNVDAKLRVINLHHGPVKELLPTQRLSQVFSTPPLEDHLHIIVQLPTAGECDSLLTLL